MNCKNPVNLSTGLRVPCGQCLACRIHKRKEWALRCEHELYTMKTAIFVTLTYNDQNLVPNDGGDINIPSLRKKHLQDFFKRLRSNLNEKSIRYFACGEYGKRTERPHYHAIIYGLSTSKKDKEVIIKSWPYCDWFNPSIRKNSFGLAESDSIRYVCQYVDKKLSGELKYDEFNNKGREPVFKISSLGIGRDYCDEFYLDIKRSLNITLKGVNHSIPRYYINRLDLDLTDIQNRIQLDENKRFKKILEAKNYNECSTRIEKVKYYKDLSKYNETIKKSVEQHDINLKAKFNLKKREKI